MTGIKTLLGRFNKHVPEDMTYKDIRRDVIRIAWPALTELFLIQLCSMVDTMMVGRLGSWAIASVAYCTQPRFLLLAVFVALNTGATALIARSKGEGDTAKSNLVFGQSLMMSVALAALVSFIGYIASEPLVVFMGADEPQIIESAANYMKIQMAGFMFNAVTMAVTAGLRGIGKTKFTMVYNLISNIVNVIFNSLLIYGLWFFPRLEVAGASIATVIGQIVAFIMAMKVILKGDQNLRLDHKEFFKFDITTISRIIKIGVPAMVEQIIMRAGMLIYTLTITSLGSVAFATHQIAGSILSMTFMTGQAFGISATSLLGQSLGRKRTDQAKAYTYECRRFGMVCAILIGLTFVFFGRYIVMLYTDEADIINEASKILMIVAVLQPLQSSQLVISGALRGAGDTRSMAIITFIGILIIRPILSYAFIRYAGLGLMGAWLAMGLDQSSRSMFSYLRFRSGKWAHIKI